ncbi:MAG TPA: hemerythrin domain-containing protein [Bacteroidales bacterium]
MKATEKLIQEHEEVLLMLKIIGSVTNKLEAEEQVNPLHLEAIIDYLKTFVDKSHHGKEETLLFPALTQKGIPNEGGPVGVMLAEHTAGRNFIKGMSDAVTAYRNGKNNAVREIVSNAKDYSNLLSQHIFKENNILFRMANSTLTDSEQIHLAEEFDELERNIIGKDNPYHRILLELKEVYL